MSYAESERFYEGLVRTLRDRGVVCAITSGMACVHFGIVPTTADCDLLCRPGSAEVVMQTLRDVTLGDGRAHYRGALSAPLDGPWLRGGWTSHFWWKESTEEACLDVFGIPPRSTADWAMELQGLYASPHTVAEMKRTRRDRDWPVATSLGARMLQDGDPRGWLHLFDAELLESLAKRVPCPGELVARRPLLELAVTNDPRLKQAVRVEQEFWHELDRQRMLVYQRAVRPYASAIRQDSLPDEASLDAEHNQRLAYAKRLLPTNPLRDHGVDRLIRDTRSELEKLFAPGLLEWLPDAREHFKGIAEEEDDD